MLFFKGFGCLFPGFECLFCITGIKENFHFFTLYDSILYFVILVLSCASVLNLCFCFGFWFSFLGFVVCIFLIGHHIFDRRLSVNLSTRGNLTRLSIS